MRATIESFGDSDEGPSSTIFAGLDGRSDAQYPDWYASNTTGDDPVAFVEAIRALPRAINTPVAYKNPCTGEWIDTERVARLE